MKKVLFFAIVALSFVACKSKNSANEPDIVNSDQSLVNKASQNVLDIMGSSKEDAEKAFFKAGFKKVDPPSDFLAPAKHLVKKNVNFDFDDDDLYLSGMDCYVYNIENFDEEESKMVDRLIKSKEIAIVFFASFGDNDILANIQGTIIAGASLENVNQLYIDASKNLHSFINGMFGTWQGSVVNMNDYAKPVDQFTDYKEFCNYVLPLLAVSAEETGAGVLGKSYTRSFAYHLQWDKPDTSDRLSVTEKDDIEDLIAQLGFSITYTDYSSYGY